MSLERFCFFFSSWDDSVHNNFRLIKYCNLIHRKSKVAFYTSWTVARQAPLSMGFSRQEYWSGWLFPSGDLPNSGIEPTSLRFLGRRVFSLAPPTYSSPTQLPAVMKRQAWNVLGTPFRLITGSKNSLHDLPRVFLYSMTWIHLWVEDAWGPTWAWSSSLLIRSLDWLPFSCRFCFS